MSTYNPQIKMLGFVECLSVINNRDRFLKFDVPHFQYKIHFNNILLTYKM